jgi:large subunit ribosomal protein L17
MRKRNLVNKLGRKASHRKALKKNQLGILIETGKLVTTSVKAKIIRSELESLIEDVKKSSNRLLLTKKLLSKLVQFDWVEKLIKYVDGSSAKVHLVKVGFRKGDNGEISELSLSEFEKVFPKKASKKVVKKDVKVEEAVESSSKNGQENIAQKISKSLTQTFTGGRKERSRSRSGL